MLKSYKERQFLVFEFEDGKTVKYNLSTGESVGKSGRVVKDICTQLRGYDLLEVIESFQEEKYRTFLKFVDLQVNSYTGNRWHRPSSRADKIKNIGTFLKQIENYSVFEQYYACGLTKVDENIQYNVTDIPKRLLALIRQDNKQISNGLIESYKKNPDLFMNIYNMEGLLSIRKDTLFAYAKAIRHFDKEFRISYISNECDGLIQLVTIYNYDQIRLIKYIDYLQTYEAIDNVRDMLVELRDYARMMSRISEKYDKYPKNFLTTHRIATRNYNRLSVMFDEEKFKDTIDERLEYTGKKFTVIYPKSTQEIKDESVQQNHCVSSYIKRVIDGHCNILFLREKDKPEESLVTLELNGDRINQAKGKFNRDVTSEEQKFIDEYIKIIRKRINNDDKSWR
ncbi:MAG: PcfJ domain-containing protein [Clostridium sp.]|uniref:PcfJ domain-containing protein n=1 Tax=Clostridium sp. TaxID=1506 RepID=UPI003EE7439B